MPIVTNIGLRHCYIRLNSGSHLRLSPGASSDDLDDVELKNNPKIDKLRKMRSLAVETRTAPAEEKGPAEPAAKPGAPAAGPSDSKAALQSGTPVAAGPAAPSPEAAAAPAAQPAADAPAPSPKKQ
jgi:hypothetical protein